jgi:hypothetical protein
MSVNIDMRRFNCPVSIELRAVTLSVARIVPLAQTAVGMRGEVFGVLGRGTHEHLIDVELEEQMVDLGEFDKTAQGGRGNGSFHLPGETGNATDCGRCLPPLLTEGIRLLGQMADTALRRNGLTLDIADQARDVAGGLCCPVGELADFVGDDSETAAGFTRTRRFDGGVECQEVGLVGNLLDQLDDAADFSVLPCRLSTFSSALRESPASWFNSVLMAVTDSRLRAAMPAAASVSFFSSRRR